MSSHRSPLGSSLEAARGRGGLTPPVLIVPGLDNSGPTHWQSLWQEEVVGAERVEQADWSQPTLGEWTASLAEAVRRRPGAVLVAHSLGCALVAHLMAVTGGRGAAGAFLVAPADVDVAARAGRLAPGFAPMPRAVLPVPAVVVASRNDPFVAFDRAQAFARGWGARFIDLGHAGHINVASGHGSWPEGRALLEDLVARSATPGGAREHLVA
jgi:hypothetical protein